MSTARWLEHVSDYERTASRAGVCSALDEDIRSLRELIVYGQKGLSAYLNHANVLHFDAADLHVFIQQPLAPPLDDALGVDEQLPLALETSRHGVDVMALPDRANTESFGHPKVTTVPKCAYASEVYSFSNFHSMVVSFGLM